MRGFLLMFYRKFFFFLCFFSPIFAGSFECYPQLSMNEGGDVVAIWEGLNTNQRRVIQAATCLQGSSWSSAAPLSSPIQDIFSPAICFGQGGEIVAIWQRFNGTSFIIEAINTTIQGSWGTPILLSSQEGNHIFPRLAIDFQGDAFAVWQRNSASLFSVCFSPFSSSTGRWGPSQDLSAFSRIYMWPQIASNPLSYYCHLATIQWKKYRNSSF